MRLDMGQWKLMRHRCCCGPALAMTAEAPQIQFCAVVGFWACGCTFGSSLMCLCVCNDRSGCSQQSRAVHTWPLDTISPVSPRGDCARAVRMWKSGHKGWVSAHTLAHVISLRDWFASHRVRLWSACLTTTLSTFIFCEKIIILSSTTTTVEKFFTLCQTTGEVAAVSGTEGVAGLPGVLTPR